MRSDVNRHLNLFSNARAVGRYAAILLALLKCLELLLMASGLMVAVFIFASLLSKFEIATTINSPHVARVEST